MSLSPEHDADDDKVETPPEATRPDGPLLDLRIDSMAYGGKGVARDQGKVWFVEGAVEGDRVRARVTADEGRYGEAQLVEMIEPSALRATPLCKHERECGGCQWMGIDYDRQLAWKRGFVETALKRIGKLDASTPVEILPSPAVYGYRNRVLVRAHWHAAEGGTPGRFEIGYFARASRRLVPITRCEIAAEPINALLARVCALDLGDVAGLKIRLEIQEIPGRQLLLTVYPAEGARAGMDALVGRLREMPDVTWAGLVFDLSQAPTVPFDEDLGLRFLTIPGQFQQVNVPHNHTLRRLVKARVEAVGAKRVLDVFCGSGNLSLPLASPDRYVEAIESNKKAIICANRNAELNGIGNVRFLPGDAEKHLWKCARGGESFDMVILDPPRQGMYKGMVPLKKLAPAHIIYVSCDPATLARDLSYLCRGDAYRIEAVTALDFFPNTFHVESVAFLRRSEGAPPAEV